MRGTLLAAVSIAFAHSYQDGDRVTGSIAHQSVGLEKIHCNISR
jgi:hypothetical protein